MTNSPNAAPSSGPLDLWVVPGYEADMFFTLCRFLEQGNQDYARLHHHVQNAVVESALLHTRILVDIFLSRGNKDDIRLSDLLPGFQSQALEDLRRAYGDGGMNGTPCWTLNKMLAHSTKQRRDRHDYTALLNQMHPLLAAIWAEVEQQRASGLTGGNKD